MLELQDEGQEPDMRKEDDTEVFVSGPGGVSFAEQLWTILSSYNRLYSDPPLIKFNNLL